MVSTSDFSEMNAGDIGDKWLCNFLLLLVQEKVVWQNSSSHDFGKVSAVNAEDNTTLHLVVRVRCTEMC